MPELEISGQRLAVIVGSGLSAAAVAGPGARRTTVSLPHGPTADLLDCGTHLVWARHGLDEFTPAHRVDHHRCIRALLAAGCDRVVGIASVGTLRADWTIGSMVAPDDFLALETHPTFHDTGQGGHRVPGFDARWRTEVLSSWASSTDTPLHDGGTYAMTVGPRFETPAEVRMLAAHADLVGMTLPAEAILAGEVGLRYAGICGIDNLANGLEGPALDLDEYRAAVAASADRLAADLQALAATLTRETP